MRKSVDESLEGFNLLHTMVSQPTSRIDIHQPLSKLTEYLIAGGMRLGNSCLGVSQNRLQTLASPKWIAQRVGEQVTGKAAVALDVFKCRAMDRTGAHACKRIQECMKPLCKTLWAGGELTKIGPHHGGEISDVAATKREGRLFENPCKTRQSDRNLFACHLVAID